MIDASVIEFNRQDFIGKGSFSRVYKGKWFKSNVAIKEYISFNIYDNLDESNENMLNELINSLSLSFPKVIAFYGISIDRNHGYVYSINELAECSLQDKIESMGPDEKIQITKQILEIMNYLKFKKIVHRDLKPANFLLTKSKELKVCDFGTIKTIKNFESFTKNRAFTVKYAPPEFILGCGIAGFYSDIWSLGLILYKLFYGEIYWKSLDYHQIKEKMEKNDLPKIEYRENIPQVITDVIKECVICDTKKRITIEKISQLIENIA